MRQPPPPPMIVRHRAHHLAGRFGLRTRGVDAVVRAAGRSLNLRTRARLTAGGSDQQRTGRGGGAILYPWPAGADLQRFHLLVRPAKVGQFSTGDGWPTASQRRPRFRAARHLALQFAAFGGCSETYQDTSPPALGIEDRTHYPSLVPVPVEMAMLEFETRPPATKVTSTSVSSVRS